MQLGPDAITSGFALVVLETTTSTNDDGRALAEDGANKVWIVAKEQTGGRGRHGRVWTSPPGNLYASLALTDPCQRRHAPQLGFVAGLALHDAVSSLTGLAAPRLTLKWPNDLLLDGAKVAGILLEGVQAPGGRMAVVIGMGINLVSAPQGTPYPATALAAAAGSLAPQDLLKTLSDAMARRLVAWGREDGFAAIRAAWLARAAGQGADVHIRLPGGDRQGRFGGLDADGRLELITPAGIEHIDAGDLFFGPAGPQFAQGERLHGQI